MKYPATALTAAVQDGATVDMRFRLALQLAATPGVFRQWVEGGAIRKIGDTDTLNVFCPTATNVTDYDRKTPEGFEQVPFGDFVCAMAHRVYEAGERAGWVAPLSCETELTPADQAHIERSAGAQAHSQVHGQKIGQALMQGAMRGMRGEIIS